ncbi:DUF2971 domain-containing protein [Pseudomonas aeruginosa]
MWSHYADKHKGICLGFDVSREIVEEVEYKSDRLLVELEKDIDPSHLDAELQQKLLRTKSSSWSYEKEYRSFIELDKSTTNEHLYFQKFNNSIRLTEVILGPLCEVPIETVRKLTSEMYPGVTVFQARLAFGSFKVVPQAQSVPKVDC